MIDWSAPDFCAEILERRLRAARLELMEDPRLLRAAGDFSTSPEFTVRLIREKLGAAASSGFDAVESSLRLSAQAALRAQGAGVEAARRTVDHAAAQFKAPPAAAPPLQLQANMHPSMVGVAAFAGWILIAVAIYMLLPLHPMFLVVLVGLGIIPGIFAYNLRGAAHARTQQRIVREYPSLLCRQYMQALRDGVSRYEENVRNAPVAQRMAVSVGS